MRLKSTVRGLALALAASSFLMTPATSKDPLPGCTIFSENQCQGSNISTPDSFESHRWYTPARGDPDWQPSFQDYSRLAAHTHVTYSADRMSGKIEVVATHRDGVGLTYAFNGVKQADPALKVDASTSKGPITVDVYGQDGAHLSLEVVDLVWDAPKVAADPKADFRNGQKGAIVELFGWPYAEVEQECADLAKFGYMGVKVFPPMEQVMSYQPFQNTLNPWYFYYQPVSYRLSGRMGTRDQLRSMIRTCRSLGVRVYADAVINHMTGGGNDANPKHRNPNAGCTQWGNKTSSLPGGHSPMYTQSFTYTYGNWSQSPPSQEFPAAHWGPTDFHCERALSSWTDPLTLNAGWLDGLVDLATEKTNVRERLADYLTDLLSIGFSGFRIDAAKHIKPDDLIAIFAAVRRNMGGSLPADFISWWEVLLGGESDLLMCNPQSGYNYGSYVADGLKKEGFSESEIDAIKIWNSGYPKETDKGTCTITPKRSAIQNDDADQQMPGSTSRDMGDQGCVLVKGCDVATHRGFEVKLFTSPNGAQDNDNDFPIRMILSSFYFQGQSMGIPDGLSDCALCTTTCSGCLGTKYQKAHDATSKGYDSAGYTRVHRDEQIVSAMRKWVKLG